ncbi:MAG: aminopeptidase P family protein [Actinobacteria bacterium]|nr:aminopeptidase P family protein [Actinomycetota bacterium]
MKPKDITDQEIDSRVAASREAMQASDLDVLLAYGAHRDYHPADLRYLARWYCVEEETSCLVVPREGETTLLTDASWDVKRAEAEAHADAFAFDPDLGAGLAAILGGLDPAPRRVGIAGMKVLPVGVYRAIGAALPGAELIDASALTEALRIVKSSAELELMRAASAISDRAMRAGLDQIREGRTEVDAAAAAEAVIRGAGAEPSFATEMGAGPRTAYGTFLPGDNAFQRGQMAILDCGARLHGYHGDMCRTVVVGGPDEAQTRMLEAVEAAVTNAIAAIRPGVTVGHIRDIAAESIAAQGFGDHWFDAFMPHGNGAGQHEPPNAKDHPDLELQPGMVLCVEPGITVPDQGAVIIEQMIAVTDDGVEVLNQLPTDVWREGR